MTEEAAPTLRSRFTSLTWRSAAIAAAAGVTGTLALVALSDPAAPVARYRVGDSAAEPAPAKADPLRAELARCRSLPANADDPQCRAAWEVNRRRFMGESRSYVVPAEPPQIEPAPELAAQSTAAVADTQKLER